MLQALLAEGRPLLADGATGTNLFEVGPDLGRQSRIVERHPSRRNPGLAPELRRRGRRHHPDQQFRRQPPAPGAARAHRARRANSIAWRRRTRARSAESAGRPVVVAGSVGPTGDLLAPLGPLTEDEAVEVFAEQIEAFARAASTSSGSRRCPRPRKSAPRRARRGSVGMPYTSTASFDTAGRTMMGLAPAALRRSRPRLRSRARSPMAPIAASAPPIFWSRSSR